MIHYGGLTTRTRYVNVVLVRTGEGVRHATHAQLRPCRSDAVGRRVCRVGARSSPETGYDKNLAGADADCPGRHADGRFHRRRV